MRYFLIAGEASGDLHGSNLVRGLLAEDAQAGIRCWGGSLMQEAGAELLQDYRDGAVMGAAEVLAKGFRLLGNIRRCKRDILEWQPDAVILIDYPGFNMRIARFCHRRGIRVFYYIAPKTWASRARRNAGLRRYVDRLFIVFPFEIPYFTSHDVPFTYKGNPLVDAVDSYRYRRPAEGRYIAILAGSRKAEISRMMPVCMEVADALRALPQYAGFRFIVAGAPARDESDYTPYIGARDCVDLIFGRTYDILRYADAAIVNSGTASLEAALIGTPQVVCWSTSAFTYFIISKILRVDRNISYISLGNLCLDRFAFRELIQDGFNAADVTAEVRRLVEDGEYRSRMLSDYAGIRRSLGGAGASRAVAAAMIEELRKA